MLYFVFKTVLTALVVVAISEIAKRSSFFGALLASIPLTSILAMVWIYVETSDTEKVSGLAQSVFWITIPSLLFFLLFPYLISKSLSFWIALGTSIGTTAVFYLVFLKVVQKFGVNL